MSAISPVFLLDAWSWGTLLTYPPRTVYALLALGLALGFGLRKRYLRLSLSLSALYILLGERGRGSEGGRGVWGGGGRPVVVIIHFTGPVNGHTHT